jgi:hypothetical protein
MTVAHGQLLFDDLQLASDGWEISVNIPFDDPAADADLSGNLIRQ